MNCFKNLLPVLFLFSTIAVTSCDDDGDGEVTVSATGFTVTIDENPSVNDVLGDLDASASGEDVLVSLVTSSPTGAFGVKNTDQIIVTNAAKFDYESNPVLTATYRVFESSTVGTAEENFIDVDITINLNDLVEKIVVGPPVSSL